MDGQMNLFDLDTWSGKMSQEPSPQTVERTSGRSLKKQQGSKSRMPLFLDLRKNRNGVMQEPSWVMGGALLGAFTMPSFGESPKEENVSLLSQILEDTPHPKYCLSAKAVIGILRRANKRGKELPTELRLALQKQSGLMEDNYGETEIENAGKVLRTLWEKAGAEIFVEWAKRTNVLVSQKTLLLCQLCEQDNWRREEKTTCHYTKGEQTSCEDCHPLCPMRYLWERWIYGSASQGQEPDEQLARKLSAFVQKLSRQTAQREVFMRCLWCACEGTPAMQQTLASVEEQQQARLGHGLYCDDSREIGGSERTNPFVMMVQSVSKNEPESQGGAKESSCKMSEHAHSQPSTTKAFSIQGNTIDRDVKQNGAGVQADISYTLDSADRHGVLAVDVYNQNIDGDIAATVTEACGGSNTSGPKVMAVVRIFDARGNGEGHICQTITGDHQNRITDYTAVAVCTMESADTDMSALEKSAAPFRRSGAQGGAIRQ